MCACLPQHPWLFIFSSRGHDWQSLNQNFSSQGHDQQSLEQNNRKLISLHVMWTNFFFWAIILMWYTQNIYIFFFINWTLRMSDNLPERVQILGHAHIICITVRENRIICCQIFWDLLLKSAFERIYNAMQVQLMKKKNTYSVCTT
jgi:cellobiose-specific phosphotransferase system component IIC